MKPEELANGVLDARDLLLVALFSVPAVRRIVCNTLLAQKRYAAAEKPSLRQFEDWLGNVQDDTLAQWYWKYGHFEVDVFEGLLDAKHGLL